MNRMQARARLVLFGNTSDEPALAASEIELLLDMARTVDKFGSPPGDFINGVYQTWNANMPVAVGDFVVPRNPNGHFYIISTAGTVGTTEPTWSTTDGGIVTQDGVSYQEAGVWSWSGGYDVNYAISQVWLLKSTRLADRYLFMSGGKMFSRNQFFEHCMELSKKFSMKSGLRAQRLYSDDDLTAGLCIQRL